MPSANAEKLLHSDRSALSALIPPAVGEVVVNTREIPAGGVGYYETHISLPTYPYERYQTDAVDPAYNWPFKKFDRERFQTDNPLPEPRQYRLVVLENDYLQVTLLPELGGRIWQVIHKPSGNAMFYQNQVVKPSPWGPGHQLGWLGLGGLEWGAPVIEHGYDWGSAWDTSIEQVGDDLVQATISTPDDGRTLDVTIQVGLRAGEASFTVEPTVTNLLDRSQHFDYWQSAMLAPGKHNRVDESLHFILPSPKMTLHSSGDPAMPQPGDSFAWPDFAGRDMSKLGNWEQYLGFFEAPSAHGPFAAVYNVNEDAGGVRVYPAGIAQGSKVFGLGWQQALTSDYFTDDGSNYVELHGGLAPTFFAPYHLPANERVGWSEVWYPVVGLGDLSSANEAGALHVDRVDDSLAIGLYLTTPTAGSLVVRAGEEELFRQSVTVGPAQPYVGQLPLQEWPAEPLVVGFVDDNDRILIDTLLEGN